MENLENLNEKLKKTEDKLSAAENTKILLQEEIKTYEEIKEQLSKDLEKAKTEIYTLKLQVTQLEGQLTSETQDLALEVAEKQAELLKTKEERDALQAERMDLIDPLEYTQKTLESSLSSMHYLKMAQDSVKERCKKMEESYNELLTEIAKRNKEFKKNERELARENEDLKERIHMGCTEYKNLYIESRKLQKKLEKITSKQKSSSETQCSIPALTRRISESSSEVNSTVTRLQRELENMAQCLDKRQEIEDKYKKMYIEEHKKLETFHKYYMKELRRRDEETERLRRITEERTAEYEMKIRSLEKYVCDKDKVIGELNRKVKDNTRFHESISGLSIDSRPCGSTCCRYDPLLGQSSETCSVNGNQLSFVIRTALSATCSSCLTGESFADLRGAQYRTGGIIHNIPLYGISVKGNPVRQESHAVTMVVSGQPYIPN